MPRSLAARTREAARSHPFLLEALAAGVVNYADAARFLSDGLDDPDEEAVATALRRYADELSRAVADREVRVSMESGVGLVDGGTGDDPVMSVAGTAIVADGGDRTALIARGDVDVAGFRGALARLATAGIDPVAAGVADGAGVVVVERRDGADALRVVEESLSSVSAVDAEE